MSSSSDDNNHQSNDTAGGLDLTQKLDLQTGQDVPTFDFTLNDTNVGGDQAAWAEANGWDAIPINAGTLDMSHRNALDWWGVHPVDAEAAFFFAWVAAEKIRQASGH